MIGGGENCKHSKVIFLTLGNMLLQCVAMFATKLLADDKITSVKNIFPGHGI